MFDEIRELSDPSYTAMKLRCLQAQKLLKDIGKIIHVASGSTVIVKFIILVFLCTKIILVAS